MHTRIAPGIVAIVLLAAPGAGNRPEASASRAEPVYAVRTLPSLGGSNSRANSVNDPGLAAGYSNLAGNLTRHAVRWEGGAIEDLGTLGGPNSNIAWPVKNRSGVLAGIAQTGVPDPLGENWSCSAFFPGATATGFTCLGFVRESGVMRALPTLGGTNGFATGVNDRREIVGWAENTTHDPTCVPPQVLQFRAVVWGPGGNAIRELPPLPGDTSGAATAVNNAGQVAGISGICDQAIGRFTAANAILWEGGRAIDIGNLGGAAWNTPMAINERGDIVGFSDLPGDVDTHGFLWTRRDGIRDLGALAGHTYSEAHGINNRGQVVGISCSADFTDCRAFLWQDGVMRDLNALVALSDTQVLTHGQDINDAGTIAGRALNLTTGVRQAFVAVPIAGRQAAYGGGSGTNARPRAAARRVTLTTATARDSLSPIGPGRRALDAAARR